MWMSLGCQLARSESLGYSLLDFISNILQGEPQLASVFLQLFLDTVQDLQSLILKAPPLRG